MRKILIATCCVAFIGGVSVASAQTTGPSGQQTTQMNDGMNSNAKMMKKKKMKMKKSRMKKDGMMNDGMSGGGMMKKGM